MFLNPLTLCGVFGCCGFLITWNFCLYEFVLCHIFQKRFENNHKNGGPKGKESRQSSGCAILPQKEINLPNLCSSIDGNFHLFIYFKFLPILKFLVILLSSDRRMFVFNFIMYLLKNGGLVQIAKVIINLNTVPITGH